ncbi:MAG: hypothetical protein RJA70_2419 [Pseudomonadota bacterium]|jgi:hypothetical protein
MESLDLLSHNLLSPVILSFALGVTAKLLRSDLAFPEALSQTLAIFLLLAIGMKGGAALDQAHLAQVGWAAVATLVIGAAVPCWTYAIARRAGGFSREDSAGLAAHYGSTSAVTFLAAVAFLGKVNQPSEGFMPALLALMEVPAIVVALLLLRRAGGVPASGIGGAVGHVLASKSILLLLGGLAIGWAAGKEGMIEVNAFFVDPFKGVLCLFLLELGMVAAARIGDLRKHWRFLVPFGILLPLPHGLLGVLLGDAAGLSLGGATVLGTLSASASYIAAPAAMRIANPNANHALSLGVSLGITFPFNLAFGIPIYYGMAQWLHS